MMMMMMMVMYFQENHPFHLNLFPFPGSPPSEGKAGLRSTCSTSSTRNPWISNVCKVHINFSTCAATCYERLSGVSLCHKWYGRTPWRTLRAVGPWWELSHKLCPWIFTGKMLPALNLSVSLYGGERYTDLWSIVSIFITCLVWVRVLENDLNWKTFPIDLYQHVPSQHLSPSFRLTCVFTSLSLTLGSAQRLKWRFSENDNMIPV